MALRMGWFGALLTKLDRHHAAPPPAPVEPMAIARELPATSAAQHATTSAAQHAAGDALAIEKLERSFHEGLLDARFRELDVDRRFVADFGKLVASGREQILLPPAAAFDVARMVEDPGYPVKKVAAGISCDPSLAGAVMSLANSALHRGAVPVESLQSAVVRLGQRHLRLLLLEIALGSTRVKTKPYEAVSTRVWKHSLLTAQLGHQVASLAGADPEHAYMSGLVHEVGTFAVLAAARHLASRQELHLTLQTLLALVDEHGATLNQRVVGRWRLPEPVGRAVLHLDSPRDAGGDAKLAATVALAHDLSSPLGAWVARAPVDFTRHDSAQILGLEPAKLPDEKAILEIAVKVERVAGLESFAR